MNSFKLAVQLFKNNIKLYFFYIIVSVVSVAVYYNFAAVKYNQRIVTLSEAIHFAKLASVLCQIILVFVLFFFMWHSNQFFLKQRKKETALYLLMGVDSSKLGNVFAIESLVLGTISMIIGVPVGIIFSRLFFFLLSKAMLLETNIPFAVPYNAIFEVIIVFSILLIIFLYVNYSTIKNSKLIELINASKKQDSVPKLNYFSGILSVLLIVSGYIGIINMWNWKIDILPGGILVLIVECLGTYLFFRSFLAIALKKLIDNKKIIYKSSRLLSTSSTLFRLGSNFKNFTVTAILSAAVITSLNVSLSLKSFANKNVLIEVPYSISYIASDDSQDKIVYDTIKNSKYKMLNSNKVKFTILKDQYDDSSVPINNIFISYSEFKKALDGININNKNNIIKNAKPDGNNIIYIYPAGLMGATVSSIDEKVKVNDKEYKISKEFRIPLLGSCNGIGNNDIYVVSDSDYNNIKAKGNEVTLNGINITNAKDSLDLVETLKTLSPDLQGLSSYVYTYRTKYYVLGAFYFLGIIMSLVFILATFSIIYFKILSDSLSDITQYGILKKLGMLKEEIKKSINDQVKITFILPAAIGILHSLMAMIPLMHLLSMNLLVPMTLSILIFIIIMIIFYFIITNKYFEIINN